MNHLNHEELTELYYGEGTAAAREHLTGCAECRSNWQQIEEVLRSVLQYPVPEPESGYEARVWAELAPRLAANKQGWAALFSTRWVLAPAMGMLCLFAMVFAVTHRQQRIGISPQARARVLLIALGDHLDRSQVLLAELANAQPGRDVLTEERDFARDLADENRLLRQASNKIGEASRGALLDDLERVLLAVANARVDSSAQDLTALQRRIDDESLLFKVRITSTDLRQEEQKL